MDLILEPFGDPLDHFLEVSGKCDFEALAAVPARSRGLERVQNSKIFDDFRGIDPRPVFFIFFYRI